MDMEISISAWRPCSWKEKSAVATAKVSMLSLRCLSTSCRSSVSYSLPSFLVPCEPPSSHLPSHLECHDRCRFCLGDALLIPPSKSGRRWRGRYHTDGKTITDGDISSISFPPPSSQPSLSCP